ncbi:thiol reductant ABC exporter subunit CydD [Xanthobacter sp. DSM 24535]|uniref:thiol reductant ABC exporter subunit CydD n=1 Tax=Roseixanthobacter psychrophilus TaxID=3119917 RepID=UPI0037290EA5
MSLPVALISDPPQTARESLPAAPRAPAAWRGKAARSSVFRRLRGSKGARKTQRAVKPSRGVALGSLMQSAAALIWLPQAALLAFAVQSIADHGGMRPVIFAAALVFALGVLRALLDAAGARLAFRSARAILSEQRARAAMALSARSPLDAERPASGSAASALAEQAEAIVPYLARYRPARQRSTLVPLAILCAVFPLSWVAALVMLVAAPLIPLFMALVGWRAKAASAAQMVEVGGMNAFLLDRLRGLATIRALDAVDLTARRLRANAFSLKARTMAVLRIAFLSSAVLELFSALGVAMVAVYIGFHFLGPLDFGAWGGRLSLGEGLFILLLAPAFFQPLRDLSAVWHDRAAGEAAMEMLEGLARPGLALPGAGEIPSPAAAQVATAPRPAPEVRITGLDFRHAGSAGPVLAAFNLDVAGGERVALTGASGAGKSTLLALIAGLAPADGGEITIGGRPLTGETAAAHRARMAWIGQSPHFFAGSLRANIALGRADIGTDAVAAALRFAVLDPIAADRHGRAIGEGGAGLSGGEALRLALARAAANGHADLILADEPTAHLDAATAREVTEALLTLAEGRTLIVATHDPVLIARMDRQVLLEPRP